jgi:ribosome biogenesis GTPase / thiamine phosphate phosphatase
VLLEQIGWNEFFSKQHVSGVRGRVASSNRDHFLVWTEAGEIEARVSGRLRHTSPDWPCVGDWVTLRDNSCIIHGVLERKTKLSRKQPGKGLQEQILAANIDVLFIVSGLDHDYNPRRLERYLVLAGESGARAVILLNKADLAAELGLDLEHVIRQTQQMSSYCPVVAVSALSGDGLQSLPDLVGTGETAALIGSSGAGKSTILNRLLGEDRQQTQAVRSGDDRGRHTTTVRELFMMPGGWLMLDLPGLRELQLWADPQQLESSFDDIQELSQSCRFRDCTHSREPGCAVLDAGLDSGRLTNYRKLQKELAYFDRKADPRVAREARNRWKAIERSVRKHPKRDGT